MSKTEERLKAYKLQMSIYTQQHQMLLASDVLDMIEQLQDDLKDDTDKLADQLEELKEIKYGGIPIIHGQEELKLHDREIRNKAVDDFVDKADDLLGASDDDIYCKESIKEIAEQLKAGDVD